MRSPAVLEHGAPATAVASTPSLVVGPGRGALTGRSKKLLCHIALIEQRPTHTLTYISDKTYL